MKTRTWIFAMCLPCLIAGCTPALEGEAIDLFDALQQLLGGGANGNQNDNQNQNGNANGNVNGNDNANANGNANVNGNDNANSNGNANANANANSNGNGNGNANANSNANQNANGSTCPDGVLRLEARINAGAAEARVEYRKGPGCERLRVRIEDFPPGLHDIVLDGVVIGQIAADSRGDGEVELEASDGTIPSGFPTLKVGSSVEVGSLSGTLGLDCSADDGSCG